jgi:hypothetical protein
MLTEPQIERYARHILLREVGGVGQERLLASRVAVVGLGPVGAWAAAYLALAGVGRLDLRDRRPVGPGGLVPLLGPEALGRPRDEALAAAVAAFNPDVSARPSPIPDGTGGRSPEGFEAGADTVPSAVVVTDPELAGPGQGHPFPGPTVVAFAAGDGAIAGILDPVGPCPACVAHLLGEATVPSPAAALLAGSLAATEVLTRIAAGAAPAPGFFLGRAGALRHLEPTANPCPHRR